MAKTFKDFMVECASWEYSQERLELMREVAEFELSEQYISNQLYLRENSGLFQAGLEFAENYFSESVDDYTLEVLMEKSASKGGTVLAKLWRGILNLYRVMQRFFARLLSKFDPTAKMAEKIVKYFKSLTITDQTAQSLKQIVNGAISQAGNFEPMDNQPFAKKVAIHSNVIDEEFNNMKKWIVAGLSNTVVMAKPFGSQYYKGTKLVSLPVTTMLDIFGTFNFNNASNIMASITHAAEECGKIAMKGIELDANEKALSRDRDILENIYTKIASYIKMIESGQVMVSGVMNATYGQDAGAQQWVQDKFGGIVTNVKDRIWAGKQAIGAAQDAANQYQQFFNSADTDVDGEYLSEASKNDDDKLRSIANQIIRSQNPYDKATVDKAKQARDKALSAIKNLDSKTDRTQIDKVKSDLQDTIDKLKQSGSSTGPSTNTSGPQSNPPFKEATYEGNLRDAANKAKQDPANGNDPTLNRHITNTLNKALQELKAAKDDEDEQAEIYKKYMAALSDPKKSYADAKAGRTQAKADEQAKIKAEAKAATTRERRTALLRQYLDVFNQAAKQFHGANQRDSNYQTYQQNFETQRANLKVCYDNIIANKKLGCDQNVLDEAQQALADTETLSAQKGQEEARDKDAVFTLDAAAVKTIQVLRDVLNGTVGSTMNIYNGYMNFRITLINGLAQAFGISA